MATIKQKLTKGKALCGKVFRNFVPTFNWLVDFASNLKGDGDANNGQGHITVDKSDEDHPIIRCSGCVAAEASGHGGGTVASVPTPFQYAQTQHEAVGGETVTSWSVVNNVFYWDGEIKTISTYYPSATCTVYLTCRQAAPSSGNKNPAWEFALAEALATAPSGGRVVNYKLYDIANNVVTQDYRTTFLELNSPHEGPYFKVVKTGDATKKVELDATGASKTLVKVGNGNNGVEVAAHDNKAEVYLTNGTNSVTISTNDLSGSEDLFIGELHVHHADGSQDDYKILGSDQDIHIYDAASEGSTSGSVLTDVSFSYSGNVFSVTKTFRNLATGETSTVGPTTIFTTVAHSTNS